MKEGNSIEYDIQHGIISVNSECVVVEILPDATASFSIPREEGDGCIDNKQIKNINMALDLAIDLAQAMRWYHGGYRCGHVSFNFPKRKAQYPKESGFLRDRLRNDLEDHYQKMLERRRERMKKSPHYGYVYIIKSLTDTPAYKIGRSKNYVRRIGKLEVELPFYIEVKHLIETDNAVLTEKWLHNTFAPVRVRGEWFSLTEPMLEKIMQFEVIQLGYRQFKVNGRWHVI